MRVGHLPAIVSRVRVVAPGYRELRAPSPIDHFVWASGPIESTWGCQVVKSVGALRGTSISPSDSGTTSF